MADKPVFQLVYVSSAVEPFTEAQLQDLLLVSRRNNRQFGITGMLLYKDGNFMQLLEGDEPAVREIFRRIVSDSRHHDLITLLQAPAPERDFAEWTMGFRHLANVAGAESAGYSEFLDLPLTADSFGDNPSKCQRLLLTFRRSLG